MKKPAREDSKKPVNFCRFFVSHRFDLRQRSLLSIQLDGGDAETMHTIRSVLNFALTLDWVCKPFRGYFTSTVFHIDNEDLNIRESTYQI